jgi:hypothetical protein
MYEKMAILTDGEIALTPTCDVVQFGGVGGGPAIGGFAYLRRQRCNFCAQRRTP